MSGLGGLVGKRRSSDLAAGVYLAGICADIEFVNPYASLLEDHKAFRIPRAKGVALAELSTSMAPISAAEERATEHCHACSDPDCGLVFKSARAMEDHYWSVHCHVCS